MEDNGNTIGEHPTKSSKRCLKKIRSDFLDNTTLHGLPLIFKAKKLKIKFTWTLVFLFGLSLLIYQMYRMIEQYLRYDKIVKIDIRFEQIEFPAITLCNLNPYKLSAVKRDKALSRVLDLYESATYFADDDIILPESIENAEKPKRSLSDGGTISLVEAYCQCVNHKCKQVASFPFTSGNVVSNAAPCICFGFPDEANDCKKLLHFAFATCKQPCEQGKLCQVDQGVESSVTPCLVYEKLPELGFKYDSFDELFISELKNGVSELEPPSTTSATIPTTTTEGSTLPPFVDNKKVLTKQDLAELDKSGYKGLKDKTAIQSKANQNLLWQISALNETEKEKLVFTKSEQILQCSFNGMDCDMEKDFRLHYDLNHGNCFTYNSNTDKKKKVQRAGSLYGLRVLMFSNVTDYIPTTSSTGVKLLIHQQNDYPFPDAFGLNAATGFLSSFSMRFEKFKNLPKPFGDCIENITVSNDYRTEYKYGGTYSLEGCHRTCTQRNLIKKCNCGDMHYPIPDGSSQCSPDDMDARECLSDEIKRIELSSNDCQCSQKCETSNYIVTFSSANWPAQASQKSVCPRTFPNCTGLFEKQASFIEIFYEQINFELLEEQSSYSFSNLLSDFGGNMGLWIGASIVTTLEVTVFLLRTMACMFESIWLKCFATDSDDDDDDDDGIGRHQSENQGNIDLPKDESKQSVYTYVPVPIKE